MTRLISRKFARYFEVEARIIPVCKESNYCLDITKIRENLDENTIGLPTQGNITHKQAFSSSLDRLILVITSLLRK